MYLYLKLKKFIYNLYKVAFRITTSGIRLIGFKRFQPISNKFGADRGQPIDRYYIEDFIGRNANFISGRVFEIGDNFYTKKYGHNICESIVGAGKKDNEFPNLDLTNPKSYQDIGKFDCVIATQVLNFIFDYEAAITGLNALLKKEGVLILTVAGLTQISHYDSIKWGDYWRFTYQSVKMIFKKKFRLIEVQTYGNSYAAKKFLDGFCVEDVKLKQLNKKDHNYQIVICSVMKK